MKVRGNTLIFGLLLVPALALGGIYKSTDEHGNTIYSDEKIKGAKELKLPHVQTYKSEKLPEIQTAPKSPTEKNIPYEYVMILTPENDTYFHSGNDHIEVVVSMKPELQSGDKVILYLSDKPVAPADTRVNFTLPRLDRGEYFLRAEVVDKNGKVKSEGISDTVKFYQFRTSRNFPNRSN